jgi:hypothetical protein
VSCPSLPIAMEFLFLRLRDEHRAGRQGCGWDMMLLDWSMLRVMDRVQRGGKGEHQLLRRMPS